MAEARLVRFVAGPDGTMAPDVARKLPGRGVWVEATRTAVDMAVKRGAFARSLKTKVAAPPDLADLVERLLLARVAAGLGLARRSGDLTLGFEKASAAVESGRAAWLIEASDGAEDGRRKLFQAARRAPRPPRLFGALTTLDLGLALGAGNVIHGAFLAGRGADRWTEEVLRLSGFRPLFPETWPDFRSDPERDGGEDPR